MRPDSEFAGRAHFRSLADGIRINYTLSEKGSQSGIEMKTQSRTSSRRAHRKAPQPVVRTPVTLDFMDYTNFLRRVLGVLARDGYFSSTADQDDLLQDFFIDEWDGVLKRFDADKAAFKTYLSAAFYLFARRKIIGLGKHRLRHVDVDDVHDLTAEGLTPQQAFEGGRQMLELEKLLETVEPHTRAMLLDYLGRTEGGERAVAARHGVSRYTLREVVVDTLGSLALAMGADLSACPQERTALEMLWGSKFSPRHVAKRIEVSTEAVLEIKRRAAERFLVSLGAASCRNRAT